MSELRQIEEVAQVKQGRYTSPNELSERPTEHSKVPVWGANGILGFTQNATYEEAQPLVTCRGNGCGLIQWSGGRAHISNNAMAIVLANQSKQSSRYLYYSLLNTDFTDVTTGSAQPQITMGHLNKKEIFWHSDPEERTAIAHILGTLDDKIELNRKTNETLEAMAKALFKSWFVDFDPVRAKAEGRPTGLPAEISDLFPDSFEDSELGEIPSGWEVQPLGNLCHKIGSGQTPRGGKDVYKGGAFALIRSQNIYNQGFNVNGLAHIDDEQALQLSNVEVFPDDVLVNITGDSVARSCAVPGSVLPARVNQHVSIIRTNKSVLVSSFARFFLVEDFVQSNLLMLASGGATRNALTKGMLESLRVVLPSMGVQTAFDSIAKLVLDKHSSNQNQNLLLSSLRDSLLPKLISGELRIPEAEKLLDEVGV
jgi:type I restriction enzyme S subunit